MAIGDETQLQHEVFSRWRPKYHVIAPSGWMNDPCAPTYDPKTQLYHVAFQWNDRANDWGNMCWGHAISKDLVSWQVFEKPWLAPSEPYDVLGVFTGCLRPSNINGKDDGTLICFYTSVSHLPIAYELDYTYGSETLSLATSTDSGRTWQKNTCNPVLPYPPASLQVTGWRDPFVAPWPALSAFLGGENKEDALYGAISGGVVGKTSTVFIYALSRNDLRNWRYLGALCHVGLNKYLSRWSGDLGQNWEVTNFLSLPRSNGDTMETLIVSSQGVLPENHPHFLTVPSHSKLRMGRMQLWISGQFKTVQDATRTDERIELTYDFGGILDHGCYYAGNSFYDPVNVQNVLFGWVTEDDLPDCLRHAQGWSGLLSLPRVLGVQTLRRVVKARATALKDITCVQTVMDGYDTFEVKTLRIRPHPNLEALRKDSRKHEFYHKMLQRSSKYVITGRPFLPLQTSQWEMQCQLSMSADCNRIGFEIGHSEDLLSRTSLYYDSKDKNFIVDRSLVPTTSTKVCLAPELAPFSLFTQRNPQSNQDIEETLDIRIFFDSSVLEVFVNERVAITTRIYSANKACFGITFFAHGCPGLDEAGVAEILECQVWDGIGCQ